MSQPIQMGAEPAALTAEGSTKGDRSIIILGVAWCLLVAAPVHAGDKAVKVFILAGQSNMVGKAPNALLDHQAKDPKTKQLFAHLRKDDKWIVRDDVFVKFLDRHGLRRWARHDRRLRW